MYLVDTDALSELRKGRRADAGVAAFFAETHRTQSTLFLSVITIGEIRRGVELVRHRGDVVQARQLERWLDRVLGQYEERILPFDADCAQMWGHLRVPHAQNPLDKQIAATALIHGLTVVTRNTAHYQSTGVPLHNPFSS
jgi:predicted nucleic acid-binding protein